MKLWVIALGALGLAAADVGTASAAWNNVFQPTLFGVGQAAGPRRLSAALGAG